MCQDNATGTLKKKRKNGRRGGERERERERERESRRLLPVLSAPGLCHISHPHPPYPPNPLTHPPRPTANEGCEEQTWGGGGGGGARQLKRLSSCKLKRHYLLTWRCPLRGGVKTHREKERERKRKRECNGKKKKKNKVEEKEVRIVASTW